MTANLVTSVFVAACLLISQLELSAFAEDPGTEPEAGANVVVSSPESGLGGRFANDKRRLKVQTNAQVQASSGSIRANQIPEPYDVPAVASVARATAAATNPQANPTTAKPSKRLKWILIAAAAAGAVVVVILVKKKDPVVTVGAPTVGNPQ